MNTIYITSHQRIADFCERPSPFAGEVDESYFGQKRACDRGAGQKTSPFGLFKRTGQAFTEIGPDARKTTLQAVLRGKVSLESIIHSDGWRGYNGLVDVGYS